MPSRTVVIAPDSFKGTASATEAARAIADGWASVRPDDSLRLYPMADGGEGTLEAFEAAVPGAKRMPVRVQPPAGRPDPGTPGPRTLDFQTIDAWWLLLPDGTGVVELANTSGLMLLDVLSPLDAHTLGFGQAVCAALDHGVRRLFLALGGSSSTDGGVGALAALGGTFRDAADRPVRLGNRGLGALAKVGLAGLRPLPRDGAVILSDVTNPLLGALGAASVFGPQKGANPAQVLGLESNLKRLARLVPVDPEIAGAGAAGGTGFGLLAWGATIRPGAAAIADALGLPDGVAGASVVVTGEGRFDSQSAAGKAPSHVAGLAAAAGVPAMLVAGSIAADPAGFAAWVSLTDLAGGTEAALAEPLRWLSLAGARLAAGLAD